MCFDNYLLSAWKNIIEAIAYSFVVMDIKYVSQLPSLYTQKQISVQ